MPYCFFEQIKQGAANYINKEDGLDWTNNGLKGDTTENNTSSNSHNN